MGCLAATVHSSFYSHTDFITMSTSSYISPDIVTRMTANVSCRHGCKHHAEQPQRAAGKQSRNNTKDAFWHMQQDENTEVSVMIFWLECPTAVAVQYGVQYGMTTCNQSKGQIPIAS